MKPTAHKSYPNTKYYHKECQVSSLVEFYMSNPSRGMFLSLMIAVKPETKIKDLPRQLICKRYNYLKQSKAEKGKQIGIPD